MSVSRGSAVAYHQGPFPIADPVRDVAERLDEARDHFGHPLAATERNIVAAAESGYCVGVELGDLAAAEALPVSQVEFAPALVDLNRATQRPGGFPGPADVGGHHQIERGCRESPAQTLDLIPSGFAER